MWSDGRLRLEAGSSRLRPRPGAVAPWPAWPYLLLAALLMQPGGRGLEAAPLDEQASPALAAPAPKEETADPGPAVPATGEVTSPLAPAREEAGDAPPAATREDAGDAPPKSATVPASSGTGETAAPLRLLAGVPPAGRWSHQLGFQVYLPARAPDGSKPGIAALTLAFSGVHGQLTRGLTSDLAFAAEWRFYHPAVLSPTSFGALAGARWAPRTLFGLEAPFALTGLAGLVLQNFWQDTVEPGQAFQVHQTKSPANLELLLRAVVPIPKPWPVQRYGWLETGFQTDLLIRTDYFADGAVASDLDGRLLNFRILLGVGMGRPSGAGHRLFQAEAALGLEHWYSAAGSSVTAPSLYLRFYRGRLLETARDPS